MDDDTEAILSTDFEIGHYIRERIVNRAVLYFTGQSPLHLKLPCVSGVKNFMFLMCAGEALEDEEDFEDDEGEDEEDDDDDDDAEYDEDEDPDYSPEKVRTRYKPLAYYYSVYI